MTNELKRYLFVEQPIGALVVNFGLNALIAWALCRGMSVVPLWGETSIAGDTIATSFLLPFLSVLIATPLVRRDVRLGKVVPPHASDRSAFATRLPRTRTARALALGLLGLALAAPVAVLLLHLGSVTEIAMPGFVWVKAAYAAALGALLAPTIAGAALADSRTQ